MSVVLEPPPETMAVFTHCPNNLFLHKNLAVHRPCKGSVGPLSQSTWTCVRNLPYLLFGTEFFIAIYFRTKASHLQTLHIQNSQTTMARIL